jgi:phosphotransacetylase
MLSFDQDISRSIRKVSTVAVDRVKFSSQLDPKVLNKAKQLAKSQGRQLQSIIEEALTDYLERTQSERPNTQVLNAFRESLQEYDQLYADLAK